MGFPFNFILIIIAMGCITKILQARYHAKAGIVEDGKPLFKSGAPEDDAEKRRLKSEVDELRERIHVLERIATEDTEAKRISAEIEQLRGKDN